MNFINELKPYIANQYSHLPKSRYISVFILRTTQSEAIFRTEGSGEGCNREIVTNIDGQAIFRAIISKRKQIAVERREGRQLLRKHALLFTNKDKESVKDDNVCSMNRNNPCEKCIDCMLYGYAVGTGGAQKSRVMSDDAFSLLPFDLISDKKTFNALYENNTMRDPVTGKPSSSIGEDEYIVPGAHFLDIEVLKDVTETELMMVLGNIIRSKRYGAISSRIGSVKNSILGISGSDSELFSTLEWINSTDALLQKETSEHPQLESTVVECATQSIAQLIDSQICGNYYSLTTGELASTIKDIKEVYASPEQLKEKLMALTRSYPQNEGLEI
ncbi:CRISPR-associated protein Csc2 [Candidatus Magnetomorum sp. HK-1]|nr:CRISPR-associated protein Csc2 [Candidatus Magnetomorum sp. HK-1]